MSTSMYRMEFKWVAVEVTKLVCVSVIIGLLFYNSWWGVLVALPMALFLWRQDVNKHVESMRCRCKEEFKDFVEILAGNLSAGYSLENSFLQARQEYIGYCNNNSIIIEELNLIINGLSCNKPIESMLEDFGNRSQVEEIIELSELITVAKRYGGNLVALIKQMSGNISEKCMVEREIDTLISGKKLEGMVMLLAPVLIVAYMRLTNGTYMDVMYETMLGRGIMSISLLLNMVAGVLITKITDIEV